MPEQPITERFLRTHWQRALVDDYVYHTLERRWNSRRPAQQTVREIVREGIERTGVNLTAKQAAAIERSAKAIVRQIAYSRREAANPTKAKARLPFALRAALRQEGRILSNSEREDAISELAQSEGIKQRQTAMGTTFTIPAESWDAHLPNLRGIQTAPILIRGDGQRKGTEAHEKFHRWTELTTSPKGVRDEVAARYFEGARTAIISTTIFNSDRTYGHPLLQAMRLVEKLQELPLQAKLRGKRLLSKQQELKKQIRAAVARYGLKPTTDARKISNAITDDVFRMEDSLTELEQLEAKHGLRKSFVATVLKNVPHHLAPAVIRYGIEKMPHQLALARKVK